MINKLLKPSPQLHILLACDSVDGLAYQLYGFLQKLNGTMDICCYGECNTNLEDIAQKSFYPKDFNSFCTATSREYEYIIVENILHKHAQKSKFLKNLYRTMENSAEIIILQPHSLEEAYNTQNLLEKCEFRAANTIYDIYKNFDGVIAKKLHMWGNGL